MADDDDNDSCSRKVHATKEERKEREMVERPLKRASNLSQHDDEDAKLIADMKGGSRRRSSSIHQTGIARIIAKQKRKRRSLAFVG